MIDAYENYYKYKLSADPFRLGPDHRFAFSHPSYAKARSYLEFAIRRGEGFITITGGPGTGKTTLINEIVAGIGDTSVLMATLNSTQLESRDLLHMVAAAFGLRYGEVSKATLLLGLEEFLTQQQRKNKRAVLIVDEAQGLSPGAIEELRLLANLQSQSKLLLQVVLVGQEQLRDIISAPGMEHLSQRIIVASHLDPLSLPDTVTYVEHRLKKVRWQGDPAITEDALRLIHQYSGGVPRRINLICSRLFLFGGLEGKHELTGEDAQSVIGDLQQESLLPREAPECAAAEAVEQTGDTPAPPLSLPRDAPASSQAPGEGESEPPAAPQDKKKRETKPEEVEDILSSKAQLREALGQVFASMAEANEVAPGPTRRRRPPDQRAAANADEPTLKPEPEDRPRPRAATEVKRSAPPGVRGPVTEVTKNNKRRNGVALLVVAAGLVVAFSLIRLDRGDAPPDGVAMPNLANPQQSQVGPPAELAATDDDVSAQAMRNNSGDTVSESDASTETAEADGDTPRPESREQDDAQPQSGVSSDTPGDEGIDSVRAPGEEASTGAGKVPDIAAPAAVEARSDTAAAVAEVVATETAAAQTVQLSPAREGAPPNPSSDSSAAQSVAAPGRLETVAGGESGNAAASIAPEPVQTPAQPSQAVIDARRARLAEEARARFARQLEQAEVQTTRSDVARSAPAPAPAPAPVSAPVSLPAPAIATRAPAPSQPKVSPVRPSVPKVAVNQPAAVPALKAPKPADARDSIRAALLRGRWTSQEKPASLLPSDVTLCKDENTIITCWSVPRNIGTAYGEALYKVEATLQDFSADGSFDILYRTLVKLVDSPGVGDSGDEADKGAWQVSEHATKCQMTRPDRVSCRDQKGVVREYRR